MALMAALALMLATWARRVIVIWLSFAIFLAGHLSADLSALGRTGPRPARAAAAALYLVLPNLELLNVKARAADRLEVNAGSTFSATLYGVAYTSALLAGAAGSNRWRRRRGGTAGRS